MRAHAAEPREQPELILERPRRENVRGARTATNSTLRCPVWCFAQPACISAVRRRLGLK